MRQHWRVHLINDFIPGVVDEAHIFNSTETSRKLVQTFDLKGSVFIRETLRGTIIAMDIQTTAETAAKISEFPGVKGVWRKAKETSNE